MQITLNHQEIETAITEYIGNQGIQIQDKTTAVSMTAGRGNNGYTANVLISSTVDDTPKETAPTSPIVEFTENDDNQNENDEQNQEEKTETLFSEE